MKRSIYISASHNSSNPNKDRGAISPYGIEGILMEEFRTLLNKELIKLVIQREHKWRDFWFKINK
jgi:hypothetical protein